MKALTWHGSGDIRCEQVDDPVIEDDRDAIIRVTSCAICGSDLHLYGGFVPGMHHGDVMGHETMGEVVEVGRGNSKLKVGDRVVVPFTISCGECRQCQWGQFSLCERSNPNGAMQAKQIGYPTAGLFGYSEMYGRFPGGQAEYLRVPYADVGPIKVPEGLSDEQVRFCPIFSRRVTWPPKTATSNRDRRSPFSVVGPLVCSRSSQRSCWAPSG